jgi:tetratricopeptide (TPR) repeat protein
MPQSEALAAFDHALDLIPGYPRAALLKGMLLTDLGNQRSALRTLVAARALRPEIPDLYGGLAYAGRTSGLLEGASVAVAARERLSAPFRLSMAWFAENTYLYSGRWEEFRNSLSPRPDPVFIFYRAYLELAAGRKPEALALFQQGADIHSTSVPFGELCAVYAAALSGDADGALARLKRFEAARGRLRIPDGELTFKVAEAYAFLGRGEDAIAVAGRAFAQGFGCLAWYERSPLFAAARKSPRWPTLREHLQERRELMEEAFPPGTFG